MSRTAATIRVEGMRSDMEQKQGIDSRVRTRRGDGRRDDGTMDVDVVVVCWTRQKRRLLWDLDGSEGGGAGSIDRNSKLHTLNAGLPMQCTPDDTYASKAWERQK